MTSFLGSRISLSPQRCAFSIALFACFPHWICTDTGAQVGSCLRQCFDLCQTMNRCKMSYSLIKGSETYADAHLVTFDGFVIPFHKVIFVLKSLQGCKFEIFICAQSRDSQVTLSHLSDLSYMADCQSIFRPLSASNSMARLFGESSPTSMMAHTRTRTRT